MSAQRITSECSYCGQSIERADDGAWQTIDDGSCGCSYETWDNGIRTDIWIEHEPVSDVSMSSVELRPVYSPVTVTLHEDASSGVLIAHAVGEIQAWSASRNSSEAIGRATHLAMSADGYDRADFTSERSAAHALAQYLLLERSTAMM